MKIDSTYQLFFDGFLKAGDIAFVNFQLELEGGDTSAATISLQRFVRAIHGASQTLKNGREHQLEVIRRSNHNA